MDKIRIGIVGYGNIGRGVAGFLHSRLSGADIPACMAAGARSSAVTLACRGAW